MHSHHYAAAMPPPWDTMFKPVHRGACEVGMQCCTCTPPLPTGAAAPSFTHPLQQRSAVADVVVGDVAKAPQHSIVGGLLGIPVGHCACIPLLVGAVIALGFLPQLLRVRILLLHGRKLINEDYCRLAANKPVWPVAITKDRSQQHRQALLQQHHLVCSRGCAGVKLASRNSEPFVNLASNVCDTLPLESCPDWLIRYPGLLLLLLLPACSCKSLATKEPTKEPTLVHERSYTMSTVPNERGRMRDKSGVMLCSRAALTLLDRCNGLQHEDEEHRMLVGSH
jgi:hypothetical protein